jgi:NADH-quinone oxidoreductase E subunit
VSAPATRSPPTAEEIAAADAQASFDDLRAHLDTLVARYPSRGAALLPVLWHVQRQRGWITPNSVAEIAAYLEIPNAHIEGVVTFYTMFQDAPAGREVVMVCKTLTCRLRGAQDVIDALEDHYDIRMGEVTADGKYKIEEAECLGLCDMAPCMLVVDKARYGDLSPESAVKRLEERS